MVDFLSLVMLVCASIASLAFGILAAYGCLRVAFALMRPQTRPTPVKTHPEAAQVL
jgi:hypothetical protein